MNKRFWIGIFLLILSGGQLLIPVDGASLIALTLFWAAFMLGIIFIGEGITLKLQSKSLLRTVRRNNKSLFTFVIVSTVSAICLEGIAQWLGKLWMYPFFNSWIYAFVFIPGFVGYWLMIAESYLGTKAILDKLCRSKRSGTKYYAYEPRFYLTLGALGLLLITAALYLISITYAQTGGYIFNVNTAIDIKIQFALILLLVIGVWFVAEFIEFKRRKTSLIKDILHHYNTPIFAIILGAVSLALLMEVVNIQHGYWRYVNWPYEEFTFLSLPLVMLFIAWPLHYVMFLSLFRAITPSESMEVWRNPAPRTHRRKIKLTPR